MVVYVNNTSSDVLRDMVICIVWGRNTVRIVNGICLMRGGIVRAVV